MSGGSFFRLCAYWPSALECASNVSSSREVTWCSFLRFCVFMAVSDVAVGWSLGKRVVLGALFCLFVRLALPFIRRDRGLRPGYCFMATPLGLFLQSHFNGYDQRHQGWLPFSIALCCPFILRLINDSPSARRRARIATAIVVYPLTILSYASATSLLAAEETTR